MFRIVGFDELGGQDDFPTEVFEQRLAASGVIEKRESKTTKIQKSIVSKGIKADDSDDDY